MKLTIGMAHYDDFDGLYFTIQSLKMHHDLSDTEIVVIDNNPSSRHGAEAKRLVESKSGNVSAKYVPFELSKGTTQTREEIFKQASGDAVLVMDCHVLLAPESVRRLKQYYSENPDTGNIYSGPLVLDDNSTCMTHFDLQWRAQMWGTWGSAWTDGTNYYSVNERDGKAVLCDLATGKDLALHAGQIDWAGHEKVLLGLGYGRAGTSESDKPFEVPAQGLGVFSCLRKNWLGFNPGFRGFGGEEGYIHTKYRQAGHKAMCLPFLRWGHRFGRVNGVPYPLTQINKVRNYIIGFQELDLPLEDVRKHFVDEHRFSQAIFDAIVDNPDSFADSSQVKPTVRVEEDKSVAWHLDWVKRNPRDLEKHAGTIIGLASKCEHVTEVTKRKESSAFLVSSKAKKIVTIQEEKDAWTDGLISAAKAEGVDWQHTYQSLNTTPDIEETDMLFIDSRHNYSRLSRELRRYSPLVKRFIVIHDTALYGKQGDDGGMGMIQAIKDWMIESPDWFIAYHTGEQYGLTVLGRQPQDKPESTVHLWAPGHGPGTELKKILESVGIVATAACDCNAKAAQMDLWGVEGCKSHKDEIVDWVREGKDRWGWGSFVTAAAKSVTNGLALRINPLKPFESLIDEAIRRAEVAK
jgi:hypothetical protein